MSEEFQVLVVDDDADQADLIKDYLQFTGLFVVTWAEDVKSLWVKLATQKSDLILLDYRLPDGMGLNVLDEINRRGYQIPIILLTGQGDEGLAVQAIQHGASDYLVKGSGYLTVLPRLIQKTIQTFQFQLSYKRSLERNRYQALLLNNVRDAVVVWDTEGKITYWNPAAEALFGRRAIDCIDRPVRVCYQALFTPSAILSPYAEKEGQDVERQVICKDGKIVWVSSRLSTLRDQANAGRVIGFIEVSRDITERKRVEQALWESEARLAQSTRLAAIGELATGVAHHINNPLTTIIAEAQLLLHHLPTDHKGRESAEMIEMAGWRVQKTVQQLADFSKPDLSTIEDVDVNETVQEAMELVGSHIQSEFVKVQVILAEDLQPLHGNYRQLVDLWVNLLLLGRDATADGFSHLIRIITRPVSDGQVEVEVWDDGKAIPPQELQTLFEPNFIGPVGGRGSGIEINICQEIVRQFGGQIKADSDPRSGTSFRVYFPIEVKHG